MDQTKTHFQFLFLQLKFNEQGIQHWILILVSQHVYIHTLTHVLKCNLLHITWMQKASWKTSKCSTFLIHFLKWNVTSQSNDCYIFMWILVYLHKENDFNDWKRFYYTLSTVSNILIMMVMHPWLCLFTCCLVQHI